MGNEKKTLGEFIISNQKAFPYSSGELTTLLNGIRLAAKVVNHEVNKAGLVDIFGGSGDVNVQGEEQQKLDVFANKTFIRALKNRDIVCGIVSEEDDEYISIEGLDEKNNSRYVVLMDPLDGSSNIDVNVSVGTIFSIYRRITPLGTEVQKKDFLQPGKLRLLYECNPIAFLAEQAGGQASDGHQRTLDAKPNSIHERAPFFCGNTEMMDKLHEFMSKDI